MPLKRVGKSVAVMSNVSGLRCGVPSWAHRSTISGNARRTIPPAMAARATAPRPERSSAAIEALAGPQGDGDGQITARTGAWWRPGRVPGRAPDQGDADQAWSRLTAAVSHMVGTHRGGADEHQSKRPAHLGHVEAQILVHDLSSVGRDRRRSHPQPHLDSGERWLSSSGKSGRVKWLRGRDDGVQRAGLRKAPRGRQRAGVA